MCIYIYTHICILIHIHVYINIYICTRTYVILFSIFFSIMACYRMLNIVPCAIQ